MFSGIDFVLMFTKKRSRSRLTEINETTDVQTHARIHVFTFSHVHDENNINVQVQNLYKININMALQLSTTDQASDIKPLSIDGCACAFAE